MPNQGRILLGTYHYVVPASITSLVPLYVMAGIIAFECADDNPPETWTVDAPFTCSATHIITQADIDIGFISSAKR